MSDFWTPERTQALVALRDKTSGEAAALLGCTRNAIISKRARLAGKKYRESRRDGPGAKNYHDWDARLFESWTARKARRAAEARA